tara:strand:- start:2160 stop:2495 length:336 start_codon:yes stop_codon:yes gene_type:complete
MYKYNIKEITKVVDGDTVDAIIDLGFNVHIKERIRLYGINTPETRTRNKEEKKKGLIAKNKVKHILYGAKKIKLHSKGIGKYGRVLGVLIIDDQKQSLNDFLLENGYAVKM